MIDGFDWSTVGFFIGFGEASQVGGVSFLDIMLEHVDCV